MGKGFRKFPDDFALKFLCILKSKFYVGTYGNVSAYKPLNMNFIPFFHFHFHCYGGPDHKIEGVLGSIVKQNNQEN